MTAYVPYCGKLCRKSSPYNFMSGFFFDLSLTYVYKTCFRAVNEANLIKCHLNWTWIPVQDLVHFWQRSTLHNFWQKILQHNLGTHFSFPSAPFGSISRLRASCSHWAFACATLSQFNCSQSYTPTHTKWYTVQLKVECNFPMLLFGSLKLGILKYFTLTYKNKTKRMFVRTKRRY